MTFARSISITFVASCSASMTMYYLVDDQNREKLFFQENNTKSLDLLYFQKVICFSWILLIKEVCSSHQQ
jgi:hypothetical protein